MAITTPTYLLNCSRPWPEAPDVMQNTMESEWPIVGVQLALAYRMAGVEFGGVLADLSAEDFISEVSQYATYANLDLERMMLWASSMAMDISEPGSLDGIPTRMPTLGFDAYEYQVTTARWCAARMGTVLALSCGTGKTFVAYAAAVGAVRQGRIKNTRCYIIAPVNAIPAWAPYVELLKHDFQDVKVLSVDSLHHYAHEDRTMGGALIIDEAHMVKSRTSGRTQEAFHLRLAFEWCTCLTGTLLHAGPEGVIAIQDIALPGLSRFVDKWKFGEAFNCIIEKRIGPSVRRDLGMPTGKFFDAFVRYLARGVCSLSVSSPEVEASLNLPGQERHIVDDWAKPQWIEKLQREEYQNEKPDVPFTDWVNAGRSSYVWIPEVTINFGFAVLAMAIEDEMPEPENEEERRFPHFSKVLMEMCREGRYDRCIYRIAEGRYRFHYPEDGQVRPGVKVQFVIEWIRQNPGEPAVLGAVSTGAKDMLIQGLEALDPAPRYGVIDGSVSGDARAKLVRQFQAGEIDYMVVQQQAGSVSMTLTRAAVSFLIDHSWSSPHYAQYLARTYRAGQKRQCQHFDLCMGATQRRILGLLRRGENFDTNARAELERLYREVKDGKVAI